MSGLFQNGNSRITKLIIFQLALGCLALGLTQVQGFLPALDFLSPKALKISAFSISVILTLIRSGEMFFSKTVSLFKSGGLSTDTDPPFPIEKPKE